MTQLPNSGQEHEMSIPIDAEIQEIMDRIVSTAYRHHSLPCQTPQYLRDLKI